MSATLPLLKAGPPLEPRSETVDAPELGGSVVVRGLMASELFAITSLRSQALRSVRTARAEHAAAVKALAPNAPVPDFESPELGFAELRGYGQYVSHLLAATVTVENGLALFTAEQWEVAGQHHPGLPQRLQAVAERLSGLNTEDVEKNSPKTQS